MKFEELLQKMEVSLDDLEKARERQAEQGGHLREILMTLGLFSSDTFSEKIEQLLRVPYVNVTEKEIDEAVLTLLPQESAEKYLALPLELDEKHRRVTVAMADPTNMSALDELKFVVGHSLIPHYAPEDELQEKIHQAYTALENKHLAEAAFEPDTSGHSSGSHRAPVFELTTLLEAEAADAKVLGKFFALAHAREANEWSIKTVGDVGMLSFVVHGETFKYVTVPKKMIPAFILRLKRLLGLEHCSLPTKGYFALQLRDQKELEVSYLISSAAQGEGVLFKASEWFQDSSLQKLGLEPAALSTLRKCVERMSGMTVVAAPVRNGVTTTLYALLRSVNGPHMSSVSIEDPVERRIDGVLQQQISHETGYSPRQYLQELSFQRPDVLLISRLFEADILQKLFAMASSGTFILCGLHAVDAANAAMKLRLMSQPQLVADQVNCIVSQRLVRKICESCKEQVPLAESYREKLGLSAGDVCYTGKGCEECGQTGYRGVSPIFEIVPMCPEIQQAVLRTSMLKEFRAVMAAHEIVSLREAGMKKVKQGITTVQEALKTTMV